MFNKRLKKLQEGFLVLFLLSNSGTVWAKSLKAGPTLHKASEYAIQGKNAVEAVEEKSRTTGRNKNTQPDCGIDYANVSASNTMQNNASQDDDKKNVTGVVLDDFGEPLPGASIRCKEFPDIVTITDINGKFNLKVTKKAKTLIFSFIGMETQEKAITNGVMKITLSDKKEQMQEVVVTGYQKIDRKLFTGSASRVSGEDAKIDG